MQITLNDGALKFGTLLEISETEVVLDIKGLGVTRIPKYLVKSIATLEVDAEEIEEGYATMSREGSGPKYVQDAVGMWSGLSDFANKQGTFMICGSQRMAEQLAEMVATQTNKSRAECISAGTWLEDCY